MADAKSLTNWADAYLVLDKELDTLDGSGSGLRDGGGDTTHQEVDYEAGLHLSQSCTSGNKNLALASSAGSCHLNPRLPSQANTRPAQARMANALRYVWEERKAEQ